MVRSETIARAVIAEHHRLISLAELAGGFDERVEHRLKVEGRTADDLEDLGGCGLLLERYGELPRARLNLVEQTDVVDSNRGLVGEGLQKLYLPIRERTHFHAADQNRPKRNSLP